MIKQIGLPQRGRLILLTTRMIRDRIGLHSVPLPLLIIIGIKSIIEEVKAMLPDKTQRAVDLACEKGASNWLTVYSQRHGF